MNSSNTDGGIDVGLLEKRLEGLRDTQESVQGLSMWCQANKKYSTSIIETWLKCLKKSPVEKRLTLFYLANDVVQHARRKGDATLINQWAVAVQKATPHVRSPSSISSAIARIFKIWEERNIFSRDAVADLLVLLNSSSGKEKSMKHNSSKKPETYTASAEKVSTFQPSIMISKVKLAYRLKSHLGVTFRTKHFVNMNLEQLIGSIKDRQHGMEVIQEISQLLEECRNSEHKLQNEVEERRKIVEIAEIGIVSYENIRNEAGIVNSAYKNFTQRVESTKEKIDEKIRAFQEMESPEPSFPGPDFSTNNNMLDKSTSSSSSNANANSTPIRVVQNSNADTFKSINQNLSSKPETTMMDQYSISTKLNSSGVADYQKSYSSSNQSSYDTNVSTWTSDSYNSMMANMMNLQYQQVPQQPSISNAPAPVFTLTPSMQLQMQMQQQHVAALQLNNTQYTSNSNSVKGPGGLKGPSSTGEVDTIPLPPLNPPLPPEPNAPINPLYDPSRPPPLPSDYANSMSEHSQMETSYDISPTKSSHGARYSSYNSSSDVADDYTFGSHTNVSPSNSFLAGQRRPQFDTNFESPTKSTSQSHYTQRPRFHSESFPTEARDNENANPSSPRGSYGVGPRPRYSQYGSQRPRFSPRTPNNGVGFRNPSRPPFKPRYSSSPERATGWNMRQPSRFVRQQNFH